jgi:two-component system, NarL family, response regulator
MHAQSNVIRILLVDDHPVVRDGLAALIEGWSDMKVVAEAGDGETAIATFSDVRPDIVLLDLKLPDMSGIAVIEAIRSTDSQAKIIVLTTYTGDVQASRALKAGAVGYLLKASLRRELRDAIMAVTRGEIKVHGEVAEALARHTADPKLTPRELDVLRQISVGCSNKLVADRLNIREDTVKAHVTSILEKLRANDRTHAVTIALQRGHLEL